MTLVPMPAKAHGGALKNILWIVIHSMETDITDGIAEALSGPSWFGGTAAGTSPHQCFDSFGPGVRNLPDTVVAYHAGPTGNTYGLAKEHAGRASFTRAQWTTPKGLAMLRASAAQTAIDCLAHGIPARWLSLVQVAGRKEKGLITHNDLRIAFPADTTHSDVGPNFPFDLYLQFVQVKIARLAGATSTPATPAAPVPVQEDDMPLELPAGDNDYVLVLRPSDKTLKLTAFQGNPAKINMINAMRPNDAGDVDGIAMSGAFELPRFHGPTWPIPDGCTCLVINYHSDQPLSAVLF